MNRYVVTGPKVERLMAMSNYTTDEAVTRFIRQMRKLGVDDELRKAMKNGDLFKSRISSSNSLQGLCFSSTYPIINHFQETTAQSFAGSGYGRNVYDPNTRSSGVLSYRKRLRSFLRRDD
ncbi:MAG: Obg family GTPase CgtA [Bacillus subtilis]|nr:Obg family GTPase CgtA [Bacillus subtilis]